MEYKYIAVNDNMAIILPALHETILLSQLSEESPDIVRRNQLSGKLHFDRRWTAAGRAISEQQEAHHRRRLASNSGGMLVRDVFLIYLLQSMMVPTKGMPHKPNIPRDDGFNIDDPTASDPRSPPASFPPLPLRTGINPFAGKFVAIPESCAGSNMMRPSDQCLADLNKQPDGVVAFSGGSLKFDDKSCTQDQVNKMETAVWDATTLAKFASHIPTSAPDIAAWKTWIGPDFWTLQDRILGMSISCVFVFLHSLHTISASLRLYWHSTMSSRVFVHLSCRKVFIPVSVISS